MEYSFTYKSGCCAYVCIEGVLKEELTWAIDRLRLLVL